MSPGNGVQLTGSPDARSSYSPSSWASSIDARNRSARARERNDRLDCFPSTTQRTTHGWTLRPLPRRSWAFQTRTSWRRRLIAAATNERGPLAGGAREEAEPTGRPSVLIRDDAVQEHRPPEPCAEVRILPRAPLVSGCSTLFTVRHGRMAGGDGSRNCLESTWIDHSAAAGLQRAHSLRRPPRGPDCGVGVRRRSRGR